MEGDELQFHYVATREEAEELIAQAERFWVSNCGCREGGPGCRRSRSDLCLFFDAEMGGTGADFHEVDSDFVADIMKEAEEKHLVVRPFRYDEDRTRTQGICFCCDDCCGYFRPGETYECDKGKYIARTDAAACVGCGTCVRVCYFGARALDGDDLAVADEECYGCGLCVDVCAEGCIEMEARG